MSDQPPGLVWVIKFSRGKVRNRARSFASFYKLALFILRKQGSFHRLVRGTFHKLLMFNALKFC